MYARANIAATSTGTGSTVSPRVAKRPSAGVKSANAATVNGRRCGAVRQVATAAAPKNATMPSGVSASATAAAM